MSYTAATDLMRFGWQTKQYLGDPNDPTDGTVFDTLAYPQAKAISSEGHPTVPL